MTAERRPPPRGRPSPGSASLGRRLGPSSPAARLSRRVARARAVARNERVNGSLRASRVRTSPDVRSGRAPTRAIEYPAPAPRAPGVVGPDAGSGYGRPTNAIFSAQRFVGTFLSPDVCAPRGRTTRHANLEDGRRPRRSRLPDRRPPLGDPPASRRRGPGARGARGLRPRLRRGASGAADHPDVIFSPRPVGCRVARTFSG